MFSLSLSLSLSYLDDWLIHQPDRQALLGHQSQLIKTPDLVGLNLNEEKSELDLVQDIQFLGLRLYLDQGRASLPVSKAREIIARACRISSHTFLSYTHVHGITQLCFRSHTTGSSTPDAIQRHFHFLGLTNQFTPPCRSDPLVLANLLRLWQDLSFLTSGIPIRPFQTEFTNFMDTQGCAHMGDSQISGTWNHSDHKLHINSLELKVVILGLYHWVIVLQGHQVMIATDNTTVVSYINKQGGSHSNTLLRLVVDLFLWLQTQDTAIRARHIPG